MPSLRRRVLLAGLLAAPALVRPAAAEAPARIRGIVTKVVGTYVWIATRQGRTVTVAVPAEAAISLVVPASIADVRLGSYVGTAALRQPDGTLRALEVHLFPASLHGMGQGQHPWDLQPGSTMTAGIVRQIDGSPARRLTVQYLGGAQVVVVPPGVPVVTYRDGDASLLVPGAHVVAAAAPSTGGVLRASRVVVGADGMTPPM